MIARTMPGLLALLLLTAVAPAGADEKEFLGENKTAMARMMQGMSLRPSGDVDRDFARMMVAHHQGAIDMAMAELRHGSNEQLRRIAQEIIVTQRDEIAAMRFAIGDAEAGDAAPMHHDMTVPKER
jgi:uncharacterized protein (DUF305 family)